MSLMEAGTGALSGVLFPRVPIGTNDNQKSAGTSHFFFTLLKKGQKQPRQPQIPRNFKGLANRPDQAKKPGLFSRFE
jgi:hypothetical protein